MSQYAECQCWQTLLLFGACFLLSGSLAEGQALPINTQTVQLPVGIPLHVRVTRTVSLRRGISIEGKLTEPVYLYDRLVLPKDSIVLGVVSDLAPIDRKIRTQALLNGDVTPLHDPVVNFKTIQLQGGDVVIESEARIRETQLVRFTKANQRPSLFQQVKTMAHDRIQSTRDELFSPGKKDRALKLFYGQLPYHPQRIWAGTQFIADLKMTADVTLPAKPVVQVAETKSEFNNLDVTARLITPVSSDVARKGDPVTALVIKPIFSEQHQLILPEGAQLDGTVSQAKPSRSFGRNGQIRFAFQGVHWVGKETQTIHGTLTGAEGNSSQNVTVDEEGGVKSNPDKNRFIAPILLGALAVAGSQRDDDGNGLGRTTVASNGFGIIARIVALTANNRGVATGFGAYAFAKSIYFRFLTRGHPVVFPSDTLVEIQLSDR
jgi:hypothetical protein